MNSLQFQAFEIFKKHSFTTEEAELVIEYMKEAKSDSLAQKRDLEKLATIESVNKVKSDLEKLATTDSLIKVKSELEVKIKESEINMIKWVAGMFLAQIGLLLAFLRIMEKI
ncbi:MAG: hypothetical protein K2Q22_17705 [Cytophagales bacterium]|nr:hypothetical protein [Cytophagales bacterium]